MNRAQDPQDRLDYAFDYITPARDPFTGEVRAWLASGETISSHTVTVTEGDVVLDGHTAVGGVVTVWVKGGTLGTSSKVTCHIITSAGRELDRTIVISIRER